MNFSLIAFLLGRLSLALSAILLLPVGLAIFYEDGSFVEFAVLLWNLLLLLLQLFL